MRQLGDLLVWVAIVGILVIVIHVTPRLADYVSREDRSADPGASTSSLALADDHPFAPSE